MPTKPKPEVPINRRVVAMHNVAGSTNKELELDCGHMRHHEGGAPFNKVFRCRECEQLRDGGRSVHERVDHAKKLVTTTVVMWDPKAGKPQRVVTQRPMREGE